MLYDWGNKKEKDVNPWGRNAKTRNYARKKKINPEVLFLIQTVQNEMQIFQCCDNLLVL